MRLIGLIVVKKIVIFCHWLYQSVLSTSCDDLANQTYYPQSLVVRSARRQQKYTVKYKSRLSQLWLPASAESVRQVRIFARAERKDAAAAASGTFSVSPASAAEQNIMAQGALVIKLVSAGRPISLTGLNERICMTLPIDLGTSSLFSQRRRSLCRKLNCCSSPLFLYYATRPWLKLGRTGF